MKLFIVICVALILTGCSPLDREEQFWLGVMVLGQAADYATTERNLDVGAREQNPFFSSCPDDDDILLFKTGVTLAFYLLGEAAPDNRVTIYKIGAFLGFAPAAYNQWAYFHNRP